MIDNVNDALAHCTPDCMFAESTDDLSCRCRCNGIYHGLGRQADFTLPAPPLWLRYLERILTQDPVAMRDLDPERFARMADDLHRFGDLILADRLGFPSVDEMLRDPSPAADPAVLVD